jgi:hypothetical protein
MVCVVAFDSMQLVWSLLVCGCLMKATTKRCKILPRSPSRSPSDTILWRLRRTMSVILSAKDSWMPPVRVQPTFCTVEAHGLCSSGSMTIARTDRAAICLHSCRETMQRALGSNTIPIHCFSSTFSNRPDFYKCKPLEHLVLIL